MLKIEAIVRPERIHAVTDALEEAGCGGFHYLNVTGQGKQRGVEVFTGRGAQMVRAAGSKTLVVTVIRDDLKDAAVNAIIEAARSPDGGPHRRRQDHRLPRLRRHPSPHRRTRRSRPLAKPSLRLTPHASLQRIVGATLVVALRDARPHARHTRFQGSYRDDVQALQPLEMPAVVAQQGETVPQRGAAD